MFPLGFPCLDVGIKKTLLCIPSCNAARTEATGTSRSHDTRSAHLAQVRSGNKALLEAPWLTAESQTFAHESRLLLPHGALSGQWRGSPSDRPQRISLQPQSPQSKSHVGRKRGERYLLTAAVRYPIGFIWRGGNLIKRGGVTLPGKARTKKKCLLLLPERSRHWMTSREKMWRRWIHGRASSWWRWTRRSCPWSARLPTLTRCARSCWWAPLPPWLSPQSKWRACARRCSRGATWTGWRGSCGPYPKATYSAAMKASWKPKPSLPSTRLAIRSSTVFWRTIVSTRPTTPFCRNCGTRPGIRRRRRRGGDPWAPWISTESGENTLSPGLSGTARRQFIVSRRGRGTRWRISTIRTGTRPQPRNGIWPR